ncbi:EamA family transporter [Planotetraspora mira]|jgi:drug/metabolite transporter (DMT)-like permease|uniref:Membrane protein n=1 Tax=Planotetraspora mira TaxID=58121 RepID=A0A8J3TNL1_9ACTN|nr:EamA family transporter [Planotetraspora mira]GII29683.1 membrane protein [Planotetraspora mira]
MRAVSLAIAFVSAVCFGFSGPMAKYLGAAGLTPLESVWVRMAGSGVILILALAIVRPRALRIPRARLPFFVAYAVVAVAAVQTLFFLAITRLPVGVALLIEYTSPVIVVLWVRFVRRVRLPRAAYLGALIAVVGLAIVVQVWEGMRVDALGLLIALVAGGCSAGYFLLSDSFADDVDTFGLIAWGMVGSAVVLLPISQPWNIPWETFGTTAAVSGHALPVAGAALWLVLVATVIAYFAGVTAVRRLSAAVGATVASLEVITGAVIAWILLGEHLGTAQIVGGLIVLVGALLAQSATVRLSPETAPETAEAVRV